LATTPVKGEGDFAIPSPEFLSPQLAAAMSHPTRVHAMGILAERTASPRLISEEIGEPLNNVTYHLNQLLKLGCIELVRTESVRGGRVLERFYQAKRQLYFDEEAWEALTEKERLDVTSVSLRMISEDITNAMAKGTIYGVDNSHLCRNAMLVDDTGWSEITEVIERATRDLIEIEKSVVERATKGDPVDIHARVELMQFRAPRFSGDGRGREDD
jgi:DNA-binding transcriptional ArsR family regulator